MFMRDAATHVASVNPADICIQTYVGLQKACAAQVVPLAGMV